MIAQLIHSNVASDVGSLFALAQILFAISHEESLIDHIILLISESFSLRS